MDDTKIEGQTNIKKPTLVDIMSSLSNITNSIQGTEQIISNRVDGLGTKHNSLEKQFKEVESAQDFPCNKFDKQKKKKEAKITHENKDFQKENNLLNKMIK